MCKEQNSQNQEYRKQKEFLIVFLVAAAFGFCIWAFSPFFTGHKEPWDAEYPFYLFVSAIGGIVFGTLAPKHIVACYLGAWLGQVLAFGTLPGLDRGWLLLAIITTGIGSLRVLIFAFIGSLIRRLIEQVVRKLKKK